VWLRVRILNSLVFISGPWCAQCVIPCAKQTKAFRQGAGSWARFLPREVLFKGILDRYRFRRGLKALAQWCLEHRHDPVEEQSKTLNAKLRGHYQYYGRPTNYQSLRQFYRCARSLWRKWLNRRARGVVAVELSRNLGADRSSLRFRLDDSPPETQFCDYAALPKGHGSSIRRVHSAAFVIYRRAQRAKKSM
jgi:hypothetical protein